MMILANSYYFLHRPFSANFTTFQEACCASQTSQNKIVLTKYIYLDGNGYQQLPTYFIKVTFDFVSNDKKQNKRDAYWIVLWPQSTRSFASIWQGRA